jgi:hypothetical protein
MPTAAKNPKRDSRLDRTLRKVRARLRGQGVRRAQFAPGLAHQATRARTRCTYLDGAAAMARSDVAPAACSSVRETAGRDAGTNKPKIIIQRQILVFALHYKLVF